MGFDFNNKWQREIIMLPEKSSHMNPQLEGAFPSMTFNQLAMSGSGGERTTVASSRHFSVVNVYMRTITLFHFNVSLSVLFLISCGANPPFNSCETVLYYEE